MSEFFDPAENIQKQKHNLPHWQQDDTWIFVTWRLVDSLPQSKLQKWEQDRNIWLSLNPQPWSPETEEKYHREFSQKIDHWLDAGYGSCCLKKKTNADILAAAFMHFNQQRYELSDFVIMPNHVHALFQPLGENQLSDILHTWKRFSARKINQEENRSGALWQPDYWDRLIRSQEHFLWVQNYIKNNPKSLPSGSFHLWSAGL